MDNYEDGNDDDYGDAGDDIHNDLNLPYRH